MGDISKNFSYSEFNCRDGAEVPEEYKPNVRRIVEEILQPMRDVIGKSIRITSGYRTTAYNKACGGATKSQHLKANAADIQIKGMTSAQVQQFVRGFMTARLHYIGEGGGVGYYKNFTHVDIRAGTKVSFWDKT